MSFANLWEIPSNFQVSNKLASVMGHCRLTQTTEEQKQVGRQLKVNPHILKMKTLRSPRGNSRQLLVAAAATEHRIMLRFSSALALPTGTLPKAGCPPYNLFQKTSHSDENPFYNHKQSGGVTSAATEECKYVLFLLQLRTTNKGKLGLSIQRTRPEESTRQSLKTYSLPPKLHSPF